MASLPVSLPSRRDRSSLAKRTGKLSPFRIELDRTVTVQNTDKKIPFSLFQRHFTPQETLNLRFFPKAAAFL